MSLRDKYKKETGKEALYEDREGNLQVTFEYAKYLETKVNNSGVLDNVVQRSEPLNCTFELGVENCGFKSKDVFTCKHIRKCDMCAN